MDMKIGKLVLLRLLTMKIGDLIQRKWITPEAKERYFRFGNSNADVVYLIIDKDKDSGYWIVYGPASEPSITPRLLQRNHWKTISQIRIY